MHTPQATGSELSIIFQQVLDDVKKNGYIKKTSLSEDIKECIGQIYYQGLLILMEPKGFLPYIVIGIEKEDHFEFFPIGCRGSTPIAWIGLKDPYEAVAKFLRSKNTDTPAGNEKTPTWAYFVSELAPT